MAQNYNSNNISKNMDVHLCDKYSDDDEHPNILEKLTDCEYYIRKFHENNERGFIMSLATSSRTSFRTSQEHLIEKYYKLYLIAKRLSQLFQEVFSKKSPKIELEKNMIGLENERNSIKIIHFILITIHHFQHFH